MCCGPRSQQAGRVLQKETDAGSDCLKLFLATPATPGGGCETPVRAGNSPVRGVVLFFNDTAHARTHGGGDDKLLFVLRRGRANPTSVLVQVFSRHLMVMCFLSVENVKTKYNKHSTSNIPGYSTFKLRLQFHTKKKLAQHSQTR